jgi:AcrR family transcriptional regulator
VSRPAHSRISPAERRAQIIAATHKVTLARGLHDLRIVDVAHELGVSTGLIHYHFATKHELIEAMLRATAAEELAVAMEALAARPDPADQLEFLIETYLPAPRRDQTWVLWIDVWGEALRDPVVRRISEELDDGWVNVFAGVIAAGIEAGTFRTDDPLASAWRLCALLDGLGLQVVLHAHTMSINQMRAHVRHAAELELGYQMARTAR